MTNEIAKIGQGSQANTSSSLESVFGGLAPSMERPDFIPAGREGTEGITADDLRLPRLGFAQGLSPQLIPGKTEFIDGLGMFDMFNDATNQIYGKAPIWFIVVRRDTKGIEFIPRSEGGGIRDMNVPLTRAKGDYVDERLKWHGTEPPKATKFTEFVALRIQDTQGNTEPIIVSVKETNKFNRRAAANLTGYINNHAQQRDVPIYGAIYTVTPKPETNDKGTFATPLFSFVGFLPKNEVGKRLYDDAMKYLAGLEGKSIAPPREPGDEDFIDAEDIRRDPVPRENM